MALVSESGSGKPSFSTVLFPCKRLNEPRIKWLSRQCILMNTKQNKNTIPPLTVINLALLQLKVYKYIELQ